MAVGQVRLVAVSILHVVRRGSSVITRSLNYFFEMVQPDGLSSWWCRVHYWELCSIYGNLIYRTRETLRTTEEEHEI